MNIGDSFINNYTVTPKVYEGFIHTFEDNNPLHTNLEFANKHGMPQVVMHGNILNGFLSHFIGEALPKKNVIIHTQSINFYLPVFLHDNVTLQADITEQHESVKTFVFKFIFRNQHGKRVAKGLIQIGLI
jgi:3-hydroxybutyryl-CoA dehydratase